MPSLKSVIELWRAAGTDFSMNDIERSIDDRYGCQLNAATDAQIEATIKLVDSIMDDRMERLRAKDPGAAAADAEDDAEDEFDAPPVTDELPLVPPAPQVTTPPPTPPVVTAPRTIPRLPPIRRPGMQAAPTATMTPAVAPQADVKPASRRPAFHPTEIEMREQEERDMREKAEREQRERDAAAVAVRKPGAGRLPTSRRPAFLDNLAEDDPLE
jgi:hypothetical protein